MRSLRQSSSHPNAKSLPTWFWLGIGGLFVGSAILRFWGLTRFNTLVFDEVYFARYGENYLTHTPFFDVHPPLGKYLIGLGIWISQFTPLNNTVITRADNFELPTASFRWLNALTGAFIPPIVAGIAYQLTRRVHYALLAGFFTALDGLFLVESRYALINVYLVLFGLLGQLFWLMALYRTGRSRHLWLLLSGLALGCCISVKWNGLAFLVSIYGLWVIAQIYQWLNSTGLAQRISLFPRYLYPIATSSSQPPEPKPSGVTNYLMLTQLAGLQGRSLLGYFGLLPLVVYVLLWQPHLRWNTTESFWTLHQQILRYHQSLGGMDEHPYCSSWYSWPLMLRPVGYFYKKIEQPVNAALNGLSEGTSAITHYDVHGMGNPILYWFATLGVLVLVGVLGQWVWRWLGQLVQQHQINPVPRPNSQFGVALYLIANYAANWLPWARISRCAFLYHYMGASIFSFMAIAWVLYRLIRGRDLFLRLVGMSAIVLIVWAFFFWLPIFLGLPLSESGFRGRMWFNSWY